MTPDSDDDIALNPPTLFPLLVEDSSEAGLLLDGPWGAAWRRLHDWQAWPGAAFALVGPSGSGKSHFALAWSQRVGARYLRARASPAEARQTFEAAGGRLVVEDCDRGLDDEAMFLVADLARAQGGAVLMTGRNTPAQWPAASPDLASRLAALAIAELKQPDDDAMQSLLKRLCRLHYVRMSDEAAAYIIKRIERSFSMVHAVARLFDEYSFQAARPVTVPVARRLLARAPFALAEEDEP